MEARPPLLETRDLRRVYPDGNVVAVDNVNLRIRHGEFVAIMGPSGSGKSTLLSLLGALDVPTAGTVLYEGQSLEAIGNLDELRSKKIGFVFQSFYLLPTLTALENVQIPMFEGDRTRRDRQLRAETLLSQVGLGHRLHHLPSHLSIGERQRVAIARSLANDPLLILADEPTGNLDSQTAGGIMDLFVELHESKDTAIVLITHSAEVAAYAQRTIHVQDGNLTDDVT